VFQTALTVDVDRRLLESTGCLFVKQRAGYLSYAVDPKVLHSVHYKYMYAACFWHLLKEYSIGAVALCDFCFLGGIYQFFLLI